MYTKGKWEISGNLDEFYIRSESGMCIATIVGEDTNEPKNEKAYCNINEAKANARLIAAAPDLLKMCKEFVFIEKTTMSKKIVKLRIAMAKDVIAKAESEGKNEHRKN